MKITIIGSPGSGKSTLAAKLHKILNIPLFHLDQYFWKPGWQTSDREEFKKIHHRLCDASEWIIEGMATWLFDYRAEEADIIIFIDMPLYLCFYRIFKRAFFNFGKVFFSSAPDCPERFPSREFLRYVWVFDKKQRPLIKEILSWYENDHKKKIFVVKNKREMENLIFCFMKRQV